MTAWFVLLIDVDISILFKKEKFHRIKAFKNMRRQKLSIFSTNRIISVVIIIAPSFCIYILTLFWSKKFVKLKSSKYSSRQKLGPFLEYIDLIATSSCLSKVEKLVKSMSSKVNWADRIWAHFYKALLKFNHHFNFALIHNNPSSLDIIQNIFLRKKLHQIKEFANVRAAF